MPDRFPATMLRALRRLLLRTTAVDDAWDRLPCPVPLPRYGSGARRDFGWYFEGHSRVPISSLEQMQAWLLGCRYVRDRELFVEADFWQHPCTFEQFRCGDCEDFALWTWRKLAELGYEAELVAGYACRPGQPPEPHTWVIFEGDGRRQVFDPAVREAPRMIRPLDDVRAEYLPEVSVDRHLRRYVFGGYRHRRLARAA